ncbi:hypothetical protein HYC85_012931 [Camellia sinensis]|uniref:non-specific serine/threonine protein kinase n=1 Tax=Camellia sinensis TaxID=4442 RepID=A0A7J7HG71_CAMSI|nr:hypothetical protein HYC85_012931 [Camellia sinensis]
MYHLLRQPGSQTNPRKNGPHTTMKNQISDGSILQDQVISHSLNFRSPQIYCSDTTMLETKHITGDRKHMNVKRGSRPIIVTRVSRITGLPHLMLHGLGCGCVFKCSGLRRNWRTYIYRMSNSFAAIVGGVVGALAVLAIAIGIACYCISQCRNLSNRNSDTGSSEPPAIGLLRDGNFVAIKRRSGVPRQELVEEVTYLSGIWHRNLLALLDKGEDSATKLDFKQRLSIGLGAAKGLCHLHSQKPPIVHGNFKTANVLVDANFIAKVADAGVCKLLQRIDDAGPSSRASGNVFQDPEVDQMRNFSEMNDVYSFGVFLLELVTGREASHIDSFGSNERTYKRYQFLNFIIPLNFMKVETHLSSNDFVDRRLVGSFTTEVMKDFIRLTLQCMSFPGERRPKMEMVVSELDRILDKEITLTTVMGEGSTTVTPGSTIGSRLHESIESISKACLNMT